MITVTRTVGTTRMIIVTSHCHGVTVTASVRPGFNHQCQLESFVIGTVTVRTAAGAAKRNDSVTVVTNFRVSGFYPFNDYCSLFLPVLENLKRSIKPCKLVQIIMVSRVIDIFGASGPGILTRTPGPINLHILVYESCDSRIIYHAT